MKKYVAKTKEEADYISNYDPTKYYPNPAVTVDLAVYAFDDTKNTLKLLLIERGGFPYKGDRLFQEAFWISASRRSARREESSKRRRELRAWTHFCTAFCQSQSEIRAKG